MEWKNIHKRYVKDIPHQKKKKRLNLSYEQGREIIIIIIIFRKKGKAIPRHTLS